MSFKSLHHSFDVDLCQKYGMEEAVLIHHFQHWIRVNKRLGRNFHEGRTWTYQTFEEIAAHFPYWTKDQVRDHLTKMCEGKRRKGKAKDYEPVLMKGNFNNSKFDRTTWYAFIDEETFLSSTWGNPQIEAAATPNGSGGNPSPIPDNINHILKPDIARKNAGAKGAAPPPPDPKPEKESFGQFVKLTKEEFESLCNFCGGHTPLQVIIAEMNDYIASTGRKPYEDYAAAIRNWKRKEEKRSPQWKATSQTTSNNFKNTSSGHATPAPVSLTSDSLKNILEKYSNGLSPDVEL